MDYCLTEVWAVLPERIVERATVVVEEGVIVSVVEEGPATPRAVSGRGSVCLPGLVDPHSVVGTTSLSAAGITTQFRASRPSSDDRDLEQDLCERPTVGTHAAFDRRPILCIDLDQPSGFDAVTECARRCAATCGSIVVSIAGHVDATSAEPDGDADAVRLEWFTIQAEAQRVRLAVRRAVTADDVDRAVDWGATIAEFPVTIEAARRAHERGLSIVCAATDLVRRPSIPLAVDPLALVELGLCDALASTNDPVSLVDAVSLLVLRGVCDLRTAVRLVTSAPAALTGLSDRGRLSAGHRGDLVVLRPNRERFRVDSTVRAGITVEGVPDGVAN